MIYSNEKYNKKYVDISYTHILYYMLREEENGLLFKTNLEGS